MADNQQSGSQSHGQQNRPQLSWGQSSNQGNRDRATQTSTAAVKQPSPASSQLIGMFIAGLIIGLLVAWAWFDLRSSASGGTSATSTSTDQFAITQTAPNTSGEKTTGTGSESQSGADGTQVNGATITVPATEKAGYMVAVSSITSDKPVWAVVYGDAHQTQILGAGRFAATKSGSVELLYPTVAGHTYYVGLVTDTPSHTWGTHTEHQAVLGSDGAPVMTQFTAK